MFKDPKIQLSIVAFVVFFITWSILSLWLKVDVSNPFMAFVATSTAAAWNMLLVFVKPDGGIPTPSDVEPAEPVQDVKDEVAK